jgi:Transposase
VGTVPAKPGGVGVPQCRIIYDKFHILQHAGQAVDDAAS